MKYREAMADVPRRRFTTRVASWPFVGLCLP
jgi:hypothetical protein